MTEEKPKEKEKTNIELANEAADRMKVENDRFETLLNRQEAIKVEETLGGISEAGTEPAEVKEETAQEYAKKVVSGEL